jgi:adenylate cyclase
MTQEGFKRKLTSIFSADAVGYSRLMGDNEADTVRTLTSYRDVIFTLIKQHNGTVIDSPGDNLLAEFVSVVDAVQCAVAVQKELKARNDDLSENRRMQFRIGVNLGDVIDEEDRIYGDGVNIAARLESLAEPGGICISKTAFDHIESKLPYGYEFLGDQTVKNISKPVGAYRVMLEPRVTVAREPEEKKSAQVWRIPIFVGAAVVLVLVFAVGVWQFYVRRPSVEPASVVKMAYPLPDKPSIAVLSFDNLSGDPNQDYISDGITANIISALSKIGELFVIARNSTFVYKGEAVKIRQIAEELGVRYVLEGSVQRSMDKIRVTAQLIDATTGYHVWSEKYDREIKDFFQILDEITQKIAISLQAKLTHGEQVLRWYGTTNFEAWSYTVNGWSIFETYTKSNNQKARELFEEALKIDPDYAFARVALAWTYTIDARYGFTKNHSEYLDRALQIAQKAKASDNTLPEVYACLNLIYLFQRKYEKAITEAQKSIEFGPNSALSYVLYAMTMYYVGNFDDAIVLTEQALRLSPYGPVWYLAWLGQCLRAAGRHQEALEVWKRCLDRAQRGEWPRVWAPHCQLAITYVMMGQYDKGRSHMAEALKLNPKISSGYFRAFYAYFKDPVYLEDILKALYAAGLPE